MFLDYFKELHLTLDGMAITKINDLQLEHNWSQIRRSPWCQPEQGGLTD
jgi:hypothetical protein